MSLNVILTPKKTINGLVSEPNAGKSQLPYEFKREDFDYFGVSNYGTGHAVFDIAGDVRPFFSPGDIIYTIVKTGSIRAGIYIVIDCLFVSGNSRLETTSDNEGIASTGSINNLSAFPNYKVQIQLLEPGGAKLMELEPKFTPEQSGRLFIDIENYITAIQENLFQPSILYILGYRPIWTGLVTPEYSGTFGNTGAGNDGRARLQNVTPYTLAVGDYVYIEWTGDEYPAGNYKVAELVSTAIDIELPYVSPASTGGTISPYAYLPTDQVQAIFARKKIGQLGGSNLWEHLLRPNANLPAFDSYNDNSNMAWNGSFWAGSATGQTQRIGANPMTGYKVGIKYYTLVDFKFTFSGSHNGGVSISVNDGTNWRYYSFKDSVINGQRVTAIVPVNDVLNLGADSARIFIEFSGSGLSSSSLEIYRVENSEAQLLTRFKNPLMWRGWPRSVNFLQDALLTSRIDTQVKTRTEGVDENKNFISGSGTNTTYPTNTGLVRHFIPIVANAANAFYISFVCNETDAVTAVSEKLYYQVLEPCRNPVMLRYVNELGAWEEHLFSIGQEVNNQASEGVQYQRGNFQDQELNEGGKRRRFAESTQQVLLIAEGLTRDQAQALAEIKTSEIVYLFRQPDESDRVRVVVAGEFGTNYDTRERAIEYRVLIELPDNYNIYD